MVRTHTDRRSFISVAKIRHGYSDIEVQHFIGQTNPSSLTPVKKYYPEANRSRVFDIKIEKE
jgi:hypothetical protein